MLTKNNELFFDKSFLFSQGASKSTASSSKSPHLDSGSRAWLPIDTISYGVQDLVYTRVFSLIVVQDCTDIRVQNNNIPFVCYAFVCDSRQVNKVRFFFMGFPLLSSSTLYHNRNVSLDSLGFQSTLTSTRLAEAEKPTSRNQNIELKQHFFSTYLTIPFKDSDEVKLGFPA